MRRAHPGRGGRADAAFGRARGPGPAHRGGRRTARRTQEGRLRHVYPALQKATGRSESALKRRLATLRDSGAVFFDVEFDSEYFGWTHFALLNITAEPAALDSVGRALAAHREVAFAGAVSGSCNLMAVTGTYRQVR